MDGIAVENHNLSEVDVLGVKPPLRRSIRATYRLDMIGYTFGDTTVAVSWYNSDRLHDERLGEHRHRCIGVRAHPPKAGGRRSRGSVQNYEVTMPGMKSMDETVIASSERSSSSSRVLTSRDRS